MATPDNDDFRTYRGQKKGRFKKSAREEPQALAGRSGNWIGVPVYTGRGFAIRNGSKI
jgi:hypothetical protein